MIRIDRGKVPEPQALRSERVRRSLREAAEFFAVPAEQRRQRRFRADNAPLSLAAVRHAVARVFHGKCAYCERPVSPRAHGAIDHFRPRQNAVGADGVVSPDHYWALVYAWSNLYLSCLQCNQIKASRFPVDGPRARADAGPEEVASERRVLVDPCAEDPADHLAFDDRGTVASSTERGYVTVEVLALNRTELVEARRARLAEVEEALAATPEPKRASVVRAFVRDDAPFAGMMRQVVARRFPGLDVSRRRAPRRAARPGAVAAAPPAAAPPGVAPPPPRPAAEVEKLVASFQAAQTRQEAYSVDREEVKRDYFIRRRLVERVVIRNFRAIEELELRSAEPGLDPGSQADDVAPSGAPWLTLLGENGTGKSSVLQAIALALGGGDALSALPLDPAADYVRHGAEAGEVQVWLTGSADPIRLGFSREGTRFESEAEGAKVLMLGYGATRLLPRPGTVQPPSKRFVGVDNLFDPFTPLADADGWLLTLDDDRFDAVAAALKLLLSLEEEDRLERDGQRVLARVGGVPVRLRLLSDGYQTVVALAVDIMRVMLDRWSAMEVAEGLVLVDEVGTHLHPSWRMRIVGALRRVFPRVQFIVSTHDPLCLRGVRNGEVVVLRKDEEHRVFAVADLPPVEGLRVDQLLTSEFFGLDSTLDPRTDELFREYHRLLALRAPGPSERQRLGEVREALRPYRVLGGDRREQLMLEAIDQFLGEERRTRDAQGRRLLRAGTRRELVRIWKSVKPGGRS